MDLSLTSLPVYTALCAALLMLMHVVLIFRVIGQRGKHEINIGDGGNAEMQQAMRVQGNFVENAPIFLVGLALIELISGSTIWVAVLGGIFIVSRLLHAIGFSLTTGVSKGRLIGTLGSVLSIVVAAVYLAYLAIIKL